MSKITLGQLAEHVGGRVVGKADIEISKAATLECAGVGDITFLVNRKYTRQLLTTKASAVVVGKEVKTPAALLIAEDPYYAFMQIVVLLHGHREHPKAGVSERASVAKSSKVGQGCYIGDFATISDNAKIGPRCVIYSGVFVGNGTEIGADCVLYPNVVIYDDCKVGDRVIIQANATIGEDGYGFATHNGQHHKIPHIGRVVIGDDVEIGSGCGIERGTLSDTVIGTGCKIGDLVAIGHGTKVGEGTLLVAQVGIAGSTTLGHHCVLGGQVGVVGHIKIGNMVRIGAKSGVINDVPDGKAIMGAPAVDASRGKRAYTMIEYLPEIRKSVRDMEKRLAKLEKTKPVAKQKANRSKV